MVLQEVLEPNSDKRQYDTKREVWWTRDVLEWRIQMLMQGHMCADADVPPGETLQLMALLNLLKESGELKSVTVPAQPAAPPAAPPAASPPASRCRSASAASAAPAPAAAAYVPTGAQLPINARKASRIGGFVQMFDPRTRSSTVDGADFFMPTSLSPRSGRRNSLLGSVSGRRNSLRLSSGSLLGISERESPERSSTHERQPTVWHVVNGHRVPTRRRARGDPEPPASPPPVRIAGEPSWCFKPRPPS